MAEELLLCPACAKDYQGGSGLCPGCYSERMLENYLEKDGEQIVERRHRWKDWSQTPDHLRERQRRHRLRETVQPKEPASAFDDPWELANECLEHLMRIRQGLKSNARATEHLDQAAELVRVLGWGPESKTGASTSGKAS